MKRILLFLIILAVPSLAWAEDLYIAQNVQGAGTGLDCATARAATFFNSAANWGGGANEIDPGDTVHLCGTITSTLTVQLTGTSGNPITVLFESGAKLSQPVCPGGTSACFVMKTKSYIKLDGGTNGIIEGTANGTVLANQTESSIGVNADACSNCEITNLEIRGMYTHTVALSDDVINYDLNNCIYFSGSNVRIHHNNLHDAGWCIEQAKGLTDSNVEIDHNEIYNMSHGYSMGGLAGAVNEHYNFHDNHIYNFYLWDTTSNRYHHDGIQVFGGTGDTVHFDDFNIYNNFFDGPSATSFTEAHMTALIFLQGQTNLHWTDTGTARIYNNVLRVSGGAPTGILDIDRGTILIYNNTIIGEGYPTGPPDSSGTCVTLRSAVTGARIINNAMTGCLDFYGIGASTIVNTPYNNNLNFNTYGLCATNLQCFTMTGIAPDRVFATWQSNCSCDTDSVKAASNLNLNIDSTGHPLVNFEGLSTGSKPGTNLTSLGITALNSDKAGNARPSSGAWTTGAYNFGDVLAPAAPTGITVQ